MKILIAEDDAMSREMISTAIANMGHEVVLGEDGRQAWDIIQAQEDIEVLVSDWIMPEMDGLELCRHVVTSEPCGDHIILL